jgi:2-(1,2-epoxy-1,2-dihydrophenyl)acetyl-CoA isomerase
MSDSPVLYQVDGAVATITLNRPDVLNALNTALMLALREAVTAASEDPAVRAVIVTGAGRGFSAGADLASSSGGTGNAGTTLRERYHPVILAMRAMPKPIISAVNGVAAGAGMSIAMAGDIILAARSASFLQAFSKIGLVPDAGSTWFLPRYVGDVRARALAILADRISATDAQAFGLVWQVHDDADLLPKAREMAERLASMPTRAYAMIKEALNDSHQRDLATQLELEADLQVKAGQTEDFREGVAAFLQKRPPQFKGR